MQPSFMRRYPVASFYILALALGTAIVYLVAQGILPSGLALAAALSASIAGIITLSNLSPLHIGFLGLVLSVFTSAFADRLVVTELNFPLSLIPLALVIGCGYACLGWQWNTPLSSHSRVVRMLLVFAGIGCLPRNGMVG